jgi:thiol-disulfide isomerase/thioredoxin
VDWNYTRAGLLMKLMHNSLFPDYRLASAAVLLVVLTLAGCDDSRFVAREAPVFRLPTLQGDGAVSLAESRGKLVYLTVWASWCEPCRREMPYLNSLYRQFREQGFTVVAVNVDETREEANEFLQRYPVDFTVLYDEHKGIVDSYRITGLPSHFLISPDGVILDSGRGFDAEYQTTLADRISSFLPN